MSSDAQREIGELLLSQLPPDLDGLSALTDAATRGPWQADVDARGEYGYVKVVWFDAVGRRCSRFVAGELAPVDAEFIAATRSAVPALVANVRRLTAELAHVTAERDDALLAAEVATSTPCWRCGGAA